MLSPTISEAERRGLSLGASLPHLVPPGRLLTDAACGPLAEGLCLSATQSAASEAPTPFVAGMCFTAHQCQKCKDPVFLHQGVQELQAQCLLLDLCIK